MNEYFFIYLALYSIITFFLGLVVGYTVGRKDEYKSIIKFIMDSNIRKKMRGK